MADSYSTNIIFQKNWICFESVINRNPLREAASSGCSSLLFSFACSRDPSRLRRRSVDGWSSTYGISGRFFLCSGLRWTWGRWSCSASFLPSFSWRLLRAHCCLASSRQPCSPPLVSSVSRFLFMCADIISNSLWTATIAKFWFRLLVSTISRWRRLSPPSVVSLERRSSTLSLETSVRLSS